MNVYVKIIVKEGERDNLNGGKEEKMKNGTTMRHQ